MYQFSINIPASTIVGSAESCFLVKFHMLQEISLYLKECTIYRDQPRDLLQNNSLEVLLFALQFYCLVSFLFLECHNGKIFR